MKIRNHTDFQYHLDKLGPEEQMNLLLEGIDSVSWCWDFVQDVCKASLLSRANDYLFNENNYNFEMKHPLEYALKIAEELKAKLEPFCERIEIAGSIRRQKEQVKDIELVCIPKYKIIQTGQDLFEPQYSCIRVNGFVKTIEEMGKRIKGDAKRGKYCQRFLIEKGIKVDIFIASPHTWGSIFLIRTGSHEFNVGYLLPRLRGVGYRLEDGFVKGIHNGQIIQCPEEQTVFDLMGEDFIPPKDRKKVVSGLRIIRVEGYREENHPNAFWVRRGVFPMFLSKHKVSDFSGLDILGNPYGYIGSKAKIPCEREDILPLYAEHLEEKLTDERKLSNRPVANALNRIFTTLRDSGNVQLLTDEEDTAYATVIKNMVDKKIQGTSC